LTTPIDGFEPATPLEAPEYYRLQIAGTAQSEPIALAIQTAMDKGLINFGFPEPQKHPETGQMYWRIKLNYPVLGDRFALPGDFIVIGYSPNGDMCSIELLSGPNSTNVENRVFWQTFEVEGGS
jgi:hypothetical protein